MRSIKKHISILTILFLSVFALHAQQLETTFDQLLNERYPKEGPGATALVAKKGEVIYRKAFGMANLELDIPMTPEHVFELGSITKQFTAVAILMLMEEGKLRLQDDITKYIPDYPTHGKTITIHQLLNHTSGIKSYTSMQSFRNMARTDMTPVELIAFFKNEPMDFDPGEEYRYNNSAYIILGHIIETISGTSYGEFIEQNIFKKLGMKNSYYGSMSKIIKNRASGYQPGENGYVNAQYLSLTLPYAGGSLMSCVDDMLLWAQALHNNTLISEKSKQLAFTEGKLNNGDRIYYGYGFSLDELNGTPSIEHGGGIFGFETYGIYVPSEEVYAIVLTNSNGNGPTDVTINMAAHAIGKPYSDSKRADISEEKLQQWTGTYEFPNGVIRYVTFQDGSLFSQREGSANMKLYPVSETEFNFEDSYSGYRFSMEEGKKVAHFNSRIRKAKGLESNKKPASERESIELTAEILEKYVGKYELEPGFIIEITTAGNKIFAEATGQQKFEIFASDKTTFFPKAFPAEMIFTTDDNGVATRLTLNQGGQKMEARKL